MPGSNSLKSKVLADSSTSGQVKTGNGLEEDDDYTSSSGSSSDEEETDTSTRGNDNGRSQKPEMTSSKLDNDLKSRLSAFLPQIKKANKDLEDAGDVLANRVDDVADDEEHYIEMNLGLGVLSERNSNDILIDASDSDDSGSDTSEQKDPVQNAISQGDSSGKQKIQEL